MRGGHVDILGARQAGEPPASMFSLQQLASRVLLALSNASVDDKEVSAFELSMAFIEIAEAFRLSFNQAPWCHAPFGSRESVFVDALEDLILFHGIAQKNALQYQGAVFLRVLARSDTAMTKLIARLAEAAASMCIGRSPALRGVGPRVPTWRRREVRRFARSR